MKSFDVSDCPIRRAFKVLGSKWTFIILLQLEQTRRYGEIKKRIPDISEKILIEKLRLLQKYELITRKDYQQIPPRVEYALTALGNTALELKPALLKLGTQMK